jgi:hypothetical protein
MQVMIFREPDEHGLGVEINRFVRTVHRVVLIRIYRDQIGWYGWVGYKPNKEINDES